MPDGGSDIGQAAAFEFAQFGSRVYVLLAGLGIGSRAGLPAGPGRAILDDLGHRPMGRRRDP